MAWTFYDFCPGDSSPIQQWIEELGLGAEEVVCKALKILSGIERFESYPGAFKPLKGGGLAGLYEIRAIHGKRQIRLIGCYSRTQRRAFVILIGCFHKGDVYTPPAALKTAANRKHAYESDPTAIKVRSFETS